MLRGRSQESGPQAAPTEQRRIEADAPGICLNDICHCPIEQSRVRDVERAAIAHVLLPGVIATVAAR
jgi:hypothetical protein